MRTTLLLVLLLATSSARAEPAPLVLEDKFAFEVLRPKTTCRKVTGKLQHELAGYLCVAGSSNTASGRPAYAECVERRGAAVERNPKPQRRFLIFAAKADCVEERETQLANGD